MINFPIAPQVYVHNGVTSMVKSFDSLLNQIKRDLKREPREKELFVFFNRNRDKVKMIFKGSDGLVIVYKRLDNGVFKLERGRGYKRVTHVNTEKLLRNVQMSNE